MKKNMGSNVQDLDVLWTIDENENQEITWDASDLFAGIDFSKESDDSITSDSSEPLWEPETPITDAIPESDNAVPPVEGKEDSGTPNEDELTKRINDLIASNEEIKDKAQEVKEQAEESDDPKLITLVEELQTMLSEKNIEIQEVTKDRDIYKEKYLSKYWEDSDLWLYKDEVAFLEWNPKMRAIVKFFNSDNEKTKNKVNTLLFDLVYDRTWIDVSELLDEKDKSNVSNILNMPSSDSAPITEMPEKEDKPKGYEESVNDIMNL